MCPQQNSEILNSDSALRGFLSGHDIRPLFIHGEALKVLKTFPDASIDCCMTSPPYWGQRQYEVTGIGLENDYREYISNLVTIFAEVKRVLKNTGSFWLNLGDTYLDKQLLGIPWRVVFELIDKQDWVLRNDVIWNKVKVGRTMLATS